MSVIIGLIIFFAVVLVGVYIYNKMQGAKDVVVNEAFSDTAVPVLPKSNENEQLAPENKSELAKIRERDGGKFVADDPATPEVNEAFKGGKAPAKKAKKPAAKKTTKPKKPKLEIAK